MTKTTSDVVFLPSHWDAPEGTLSPVITAALAEHQEWLASVYTASIPVNNSSVAVNSDEVMTEEEFFAELDKM